jgi:hypothetical protein
VRRHYGDLWNEARELSGADGAALQAFFATGMLLTVGAAIGVPELTGTDAWARALLGMPDV